MVGDGGKRIEGGRGGARSSSPADSSVAVGKPANVWRRVIGPARGSDYKTASQVNEYPAMGTSALANGDIEWHGINQRTRSNAVAKVGEEGNSADYRGNDSAGSGGATDETSRGLHSNFDGRRGPGLTTEVENDRKALVKRVHAHLVKKCGDSGNMSQEKEGVAASNDNNAISGLESTFAQQWARQSIQAPSGGKGKFSCTSAVATPKPESASKLLAVSEIKNWTAADVRTWLRSLPPHLSAFAEAEAFVNGSVDGARLATLTLKDLKRREFHHAKFKAKVCVSNLEGYGRRLEKEP